MKKQEQYTCMLLILEWTMISSSCQYGEYQYALARPLKRRRNHVRKGQGCLTLTRLGQWIKRLYTSCYFFGGRVDGGWVGRRLITVSYLQGGCLFKVGAYSRLSKSNMDNYMKSSKKKIHNSTQWAALTWTLLYHVVWACNPHKGCRGHL